MPRQDPRPRGSAVQKIKLPRQGYREMVGIRNHGEAPKSSRRSASETPGVDASPNRQVDTRDGVSAEKEGTG